MNKTLLQYLQKKRKLLPTCCLKPCCHWKAPLKVSVEIVVCCCFFVSGHAPTVSSEGSEPGTVALFPRTHCSSPWLSGDVIIGMDSTTHTDSNLSSPLWHLDGASVCLRLCVCVCVTCDPLYCIPFLCVCVMYFGSRESGIFLEGGLTSSWPTHTHQYTPCTILEASWLKFTD